MIQIFGTKKLGRHQEGPAILQGTRHQVPVHRYEREGDARVLCAGLMFRCHYICSRARALDNTVDWIVVFRCTLSTSVAQVNGGMNAMMGHDHKDKDTLALIQYTAEEDRLARLLENQQLIKTPIVRDGKRSAIGYQPDVWKGWI